MSVHTGTPPDVTVRTWNEVVASVPVPGDAMLAAAVTGNGFVPSP